MVNQTKDLHSTTKHQFDSLTVWIIKCLQDNYVFVLQFADPSLNPHKSFTCVVDPTEAQPIKEFLEANRFSLDEIWITHHHSDHIGGVNELRSHFQSKVRGITMHPERLPTVDIAIFEAISWPINDFNISVLHLPGHTLDHIGYWIINKNHSLLFSGDVLFGFGCGRLFEGTYIDLHSTLKKLTALPHNTLIFCSHEYTERNLQFTLQQPPPYPKVQEAINKRKLKVHEQCAQGLPTVPLCLGEEIESNLFLLALKSKNPLQELQLLREARNNF